MFSIYICSGLVVLPSNLKNDSEGITTKMVPFFEEEATVVKHSSNKVTATTAILLIMFSTGRNK